MPDDITPDKSEITTPAPIAESVLQTIDLPNQEIFAVGKWNGENFNISDLVDIVSASKELEGKIKPFLKLGHSDEQTLIHNDELPSAGWVQNIRLVGEKIIADFVKIPKKIGDLIQAGAYRQKSVEIWNNVEFGGKRYPRVLSAVALLGAVIPAVSTLNDLVAMFHLDFAKNSDSDIRRYEITENGVEMTEKEMTEMKAQLSEAESALKAEQKKVSEFSADIAKKESEFNDLKRTNEILTKELNDLKQERRNFELAAKVDNLLLTNKILPAQKDALLNILKNIPSEKKFAQEGVEVSVEEAILKFASLGDTKLNMDGQTKAGEKVNADDLDARAQAYEKENKVSYKEALRAVSVKKEN